MSLHYLLEAAEFLEWSKKDKKGARATRTSKRAEKYQAEIVKVPTKRRLSSSPSTSSARKKARGKVEERKEGEVEDGEDMKDETGEQTVDVEENNQRLSTHELVEYKDEQSDSDLEDSKDLQHIKKCLGTRLTHNKLEKNRRAHLKECFDDLRNELPHQEDRRTSNLATLRSSIRFIQSLVQTGKELEVEKRRMSRLKTMRLTQISTLNRELQEHDVSYNLEDWIVKRSCTNSTSTASEVPDDEDVTETFTINLPSEPVQTAPVTTNALEVNLSTIYSSAQGSSQTTTVGKLAIPANRPAVKPIRPADIRPAVNVSHPSQAIQIMQKAAVRAQINQKINSIPQTCTTSTTQYVTLGQIGGHVQKHAIQPIIQSVRPGGILLASHTANLQQVPPVLSPLSTTLSSQSIQPVTVNMPSGRIINPTVQKTQTVNQVVTTNNQQQLLLIAAPNPTDSHQQTLQVSAIQNYNMQNAAPVIQSAALQAVSTVSTPQLQNKSIIPITPVSCDNNQLGGSSWITGIIPQKLSDGTLSYLPVHLTAKNVQQTQQIYQQPIQPRTLTVVLNQPSTQSQTMIKIAAAKSNESESKS